MDNENKRIDIEDLPRAEEELTDEEAKNVEGGAVNAFVTFYDKSDILESTKGGTTGGSLAGDVSKPVKP